MTDRQAVNYGLETCTITLPRCQALLVMGNFNIALQVTKAHQVRGVCSPEDLALEQDIACELQRQVLFGLPPSKQKGGAL